MIWRDLKAPEVVDKVSQSERAPAADRATPATTRRRSCRWSPAAARSAPSPSSTRAATCATTRATSSFSPSWANGRRWRSTTPASIGNATGSPRTCSAGCARRGRRRCPGLRDLGRLRGRRRGDRGRRRPLRRDPDRGRLLAPGRRRRRQGQRRRRRLGRRPPLRSRPLPGRSPSPTRCCARVNELLLDGDSLNDFATAQLVRMRRDGLRLDTEARGGGSSAGGSRLSRRGHEIRGRLAAWRLGSAGDRMP